MLNFMIIEDVTGFSRLLKTNNYCHVFDQVTWTTDVKRLTKAANPVSFLFPQLFFSSQTVLKADSMCNHKTFKCKIIHQEIPF